jgi:membrane protease YdiL (CAAX protease family)
VAPTLQIPRVSLFAYPLQPSAILVGFLLSLVAYLAGAPVLAASGSSGDEVAIALAALTVAAAAEELLFRGVLQGALQRVAGRPGVLLGACLFACTYLGFRSLPLALTMLLAGLLFADVVLRTGATGAVILAHAIAVCCASVVWPYLLGRERPDWIDESVLAGVLTLAVAVALWRLLRGRGASLTIRRGTATRTAAQSRSDDWVADG